MRHSHRGLLHNPSLIDIQSLDTHALFAESIETLLLSSGTDVEVCLASSHAWLTWISRRALTDLAGTACAKSLTFAYGTGAFLSVLAACAKGNERAFAICETMWFVAKDIAVGLIHCVASAAAFLLYPLVEFTSFPEVAFALSVAASLLAITTVNCGSDMETLRYYESMLRLYRQRSTDVYIPRRGEEGTGGGADELLMSASWLGSLGVKKTLNSSETLS